MLCASPASHASVTANKGRLGERDPILKSKPCRRLPVGSF